MEPTSPEAQAELTRRHKSAATTVVGLLKTLEKTTVQLALLAAGIALAGFVTTLLTGNPWQTYRASAIAVVVFIYCYPTKTSWLKTLYRFTDKPA